MAKIVIGRYINGISLNGLEYLLEDNSEKTKTFSSKEEAKQHLLDTDFSGWSDEELEDNFIFEEVEKQEIKVE